MVVLAAAMAALLPLHAAEAPLRIIAIDVEGGAATLYVTPQGRSLLIDAGWPAGLPRAPGAVSDPAQVTSAQRIAAAAKAVGVRRIDYLLVSHYHIDHVGGVIDLLAAMPVGTLVDHGDNRELLPADAKPAQAAFAPATWYPRYLAAIGDRKHIVLKAGERLRIGDLVVTAIDSDRAVTPVLAGAGRSGAGCDKPAPPSADGGEENPRSLGILAEWGRARVLSLGDTTADVEATIVCPTNWVGQVDLMFADNHGSSNSNGPALVNSVAPRVVVIANGPAKGADPQTFDTVAASPRIEAIWQLHEAIRPGARNTAVDLIANLAALPDAMNALAISIARDGTIEVRNPRNSVARIYRR